MSQGTQTVRQPFSTLVSASVTQSSEDEGESIHKYE